MINYTIPFPSLRPALAAKRSMGWSVEPMVLLAMMLKSIVILMVFFLYIPSYANAEIDPALDPADDSFRSRSAESSSASAFDVLQDQARYKDEQKNVFDVTEANDAALENDNTNSVVTTVVAPVETESSGSYRKIAKLVALNKITARSKELTIKVGQSAYFGNIEIMVEKCWNNGDVHSPSNKILVKAIENKIDEDSKNIFHGWLISSNIPASSLQDPSYELIAIDCYDTIKSE